MKKNDIFLICGIIFIIACSFLLVFAFRSEGSRVLVVVDKELYKEFDLNENTTYEIRQENGERNVIEIKDGYVRMTEASCPDKLCVKQGWIRYNYESITCLPNKVYVRISGGEEGELDAVAE